MVMMHVQVGGPDVLDARPHADSRARLAIRGEPERLPLFLGPNTVQFRSSQMYRRCHRQAKVVFHSVNGGPGRVDVILPFHDSNVQYRAMASTLFIATAQAAQPDGQNAHSGLVAPNGTWVAQVELGKTGVYIGEVEL